MAIPEEEDWMNVVNVDVEDDHLDEIHEDWSGVVKHRDFEATNGRPRSQASSKPSWRKPVALYTLEQQKAQADLKGGGWNLMADMSTGLGEYLYADGKAPPMSDAGVKFRESPMKWLKGLNLRSTRLAFGIYMESHIVQLIMVTLIIVDVCAVFGELLLANVCDTSRDKVHDTEEILHTISVTALSIFLFQQFVLIVAYGIDFFKKLLYVVDFVIVIGAMILELAVESSSGRLIVVLMLWRGARVVHGFAVTIETEQEQTHRAQDKVEKLRELLITLLGYEITMFRVHNMKQAARIIQHAYLGYFVSKKEKENKHILDAVAEKNLNEHSQKGYEYAKEILAHLPGKDALRVKTNCRLIEDAKQKLGRMKYCLPLFNIHVALHEKDIDLPRVVYDAEDGEEPQGRLSSMDSMFSRASALRSTSMLDLIMEAIQDTGNKKQTGLFRFGSNARNSNISMLENHVASK